MDEYVGSSANHFLHRPFPFLPDWFHRLSDHLMFLSAQRLDLFAWCVRLSRLWVGFWTHFKSLHFLFHFHFMLARPYENWVTTETHSAQLSRALWTGLESFKILNGLGRQASYMLLLVAVFLRVDYHTTLDKTGSAPSEMYRLSTE